MTLDYQSAVPIARRASFLQPATWPVSWPAWSIFLGCSWTWCIGMFLPILLVRDYGLLGWIVFAVPNVVGAAAMGFVINQPQTSQRILHLHRRAVAAFSIVTVAFNFYFIGWFGSWLGLGAAETKGALLLDAGSVVMLGAVILFLAAIFISRRSMAREAALILTISLTVFVIVAGWVVVNHAWPPLSGQRPSVELLSIAPIFMLGFGACPYLDATFHWPIARLSPPDRRRAFAVGFGVVFLSMIVLTLLYANAVRGSLFIAIVVALHGIVQGFWKIRCHAGIAHGAGHFWFVSAMILGLGATLSYTIAGSRLDGGITIYLCFLAFYALVFPAYVLIVMLPPRGCSLIAPNKRAISVWIAVVLLCLPCLWEGFILERRIWLLPMVPIVLVARWVAAARAMNLPGTVQHG